MSSEQTIASFVVEKLRNLVEKMEKNMFVFPRESGEILSQVPPDVEKVKKAQEDSKEQMKKMKEKALFYLKEENFPLIFVFLQNFVLRQVNEPNFEKYLTETMHAFAVQSGFVIGFSEEGLRLLVSYSNMFSVVIKDQKKL